MASLTRLKDITLRDCSHIIWKRKVIIFIVILVVTLSGGFTDLRSPAIYQTQSTILIANPSEELPLHNILNTIPMAKRVGDKLGLEKSPEEILLMVKARLLENKNIVKIRVEGEDPEEIKIIATAWANEFVSLLRKQVSSEEQTAFMSSIHVVTARKVREVPRGAKTALFFGLGVLLGLVAAVIMEIFDPRLQKAVEVEEVAKMPLLGFIPSGKKGGATEKELDLISFLKPDSLVGEAFRAAKASILIGSPEGLNPKTLLVTSSVSTEGRSFVAANLAIQFTNMGRKVLLIDTSIKNGRLGESFAVEDRLDLTILGLSDALYGKCAIEEAIVRTPVPGLSLLEAGTLAEKPADLITSAAFPKIMQELRNVFDRIIIDNGPILGADETLLWADRCDGIIFVVGAEMVNIKDVNTARQRLGRKEKKVIGVILNSVWSKKDLKYYYKQFHSFLGKKPGEIIVTTEREEEENNKEERIS
jgi:capsular exopolysaccharide synthesis family protein